MKLAGTTLWDGRWYIRGITANGAKIGTQDNEEGKVHLGNQTVWRCSLVQGLSRTGSPLYGCGRPIPLLRLGIHLVWPCYTKPDDEIGFVTRVYPGLKENGAIFSHANPWAIVAECQVRPGGNRAMKFYDALLPYNQNDKIDIREAEPYSYCQFIVGRDHTAFGRARHPWLTGSSGWMYTAQPPSGF